MNDAFEGLKAAFLLLLGITVGILAYFGKRTSERVDALSQTSVTRNELAEALNRVREERQTQHQENRETLTRIETKIDANEERSSKTRHDTNEFVHGLATQLAVLARDRRDER